MTGLPPNPTDQGRDAVIAAAGARIDALERENRALRWMLRLLVTALLAAAGVGAAGGMDLLGHP